MEIEKLKQIRLSLVETLDKVNALIGDLPEKDESEKLYKNDGTSVGKEKDKGR